MTASNIIAGFRTCGVCPFDRNAIQLPKTVFEPEKLTKDTGLAYIPLYSPARAHQGESTCVLQPSDYTRPCDAGRFLEGQPPPDLGVNTCSVPREV